MLDTEAKNECEGACTVCDYTKICAVGDYTKEWNIIPKHGYICYACSLILVVIGVHGYSCRSEIKAMILMMEQVSYF